MKKNRTSEGVQPIDRSIDSHRGNDRLYAESALAARREFRDAKQRGRGGGERLKGEMMVGKTSSYRGRIDFSARFITRGNVPRVYRPGFEWKLRASDDGA